MQRNIPGQKIILRWQRSLWKKWSGRLGNPVFNDAGIMTKGVIVRHLLLPGCLRDARRIVKYLYETYGDQIYMSLMNQYTPLDTLNQKNIRSFAKKVTKKHMMFWWIMP